MTILALLASKGKGLDEDLHAATQARWRVDSFELLARKGEGLDEGSLHAATQKRDFRRVDSFSPGKSVTVSELLASKGKGLTKDAWLPPRSFGDGEWTLRAAKRCGEGLDEDLHAATEARWRVDSFSSGKRGLPLELLASKGKGLDEDLHAATQARWRVDSFELLASKGEGLDEDLHAATEARWRVDSFSRKECDRPRAPWQRR